VVYTGQLIYLFVKMVKYTAMCVLMHIRNSYQSLMGNYRVDVRFEGSVNVSVSYTLSNMSGNIYEGWNFNSGNYLFTTDTK